MSAGDTVRIAAFDQPATCDPHAAYDSTSRHVVLNVYEPLVRLRRGDLRPVPHLASAFAVDGRTARFEIRRGVRDHSGAEIGAADVEYSLRRALITAAGPFALWAELLLGARLSEPEPAAVADAMGRIRADGGAVTLHLAEPFPAVLAVAAGWSLVLRREWARAAGEWDGDPATFERWLVPPETALRRRTNGTGPYRLAGWDESTGQVSFARHDGHWSGADLPANVVIVSEPDRVARECSLVEGRADFAVCQPESMERIAGAHDVVVEDVADEWHVNPIGFVTQDLAPDRDAVGTGDFGRDGIRADALRDRDLRAALALCVDHERFEREALGHAGLRHFGLFPRPSLPGGPLPELRFDLDAARAHLDRAWGGEVARRGCLIRVVTHRANYARERAAELLAEGFNRLRDGCRIEVEAVELPALLDRLYGGRAPVAIVGWDADYCHPYTFVAQLLAPDALLPSRTGLRDPAIAALADRAKRAASPADPVYREIAAYAIDNHTHLFFPGKVSLLAYRDRWQGVQGVPGVANVLDFASFRPRAPLPAR
ncbi:MAG TPA: ABC transporter substrate-binding protein [Solirubrobacteraceae bacterium]|nr:ABC transporter substrate-binding protein [Solirubrobacteraceae bacterium]